MSASSEAKSLRGVARADTTVPNSCLRSLLRSLGPK